MVDILPVAALGYKAALWWRPCGPKNWKYLLPELEENKSADLVFRVLEILLRTGIPGVPKALVFFWLKMNGETEACLQVCYRAARGCQPKRQLVSALVP